MQKWKFTKRNKNGTIRGWIVPLDAQKQGQIVEFREGWICEKKRKKNREMKKWGDGKADNGDGRLASINMHIL